MTGSALKAAPLHSTSSEEYNTESTALCAENQTMGVEEKLKAFHESKVKVVSPIAIHWKKRMSGKYGKFQIPLTVRDQAQLKRVEQLVGKEKAIEIIDLVVENWLTFTWRAKQDYGLNTIPNNPTIGFLVKYLQTAVQLIAPVEIIKTVPIPVPEPIPVVVAKKPAVVDNGPEIINWDLIKSLEETAKKANSW